VQAETRGVWFLPLVPRRSSTGYEVATFGPEIAHEDRGQISGWIHTSSRRRQLRRVEEKKIAGIAYPIFGWNLIGED
jgi:hypothetical protein